MAEDEKKNFQPDPKNPEETIELVKAIIAIAGVVEDGKVTLSDMTAIPATLKGVIGVEKVLAELDAIDEDGELKLGDAIASFELSDDKEELERLCESYFNLVVALSRTISKTVKLIKAKKAVA